jgi:hypothetical protein
MACSYVMGLGSLPLKLSLSLSLPLSLTPSPLLSLSLILRLTPILPLRRRSLSHTVLQIVLQPSEEIARFAINHSERDRRREPGSHRTPCVLARLARRRP